VRRLYLMRHGETLYLGRASPDGSDLTDEGRRQIEAAAALFAGLPLDLVLSSPMRRARGTAAIVAARCGLEVEIAPELREIAPGPLDGLELPEVFSRVIEFFSSPTVTWDTPFVGGETFRQLRARTLRFVTRLRSRGGWTTALAVAHGGVNLALLSGVLGPAEGEMPRIEQDLGCINVLDLDDGGRGVVRLLNLCVHDPLKATQREPSAARLARVLEARAREARGGGSGRERGGAGG
jgi:broad specificity phosphatase PhoE